MTIDLEKLRAIVADRGECAGPLTTYKHGPNEDLAHVSIVCRDNWDSVIRWLAAMNHDVPALIEECERLRGEILNGERSPSVLRPLTPQQIEDALNEGRAESQAARGDNAFTYLLTQRDALKAELAEARRERDDAAMKARGE